MQPTMPGGQIGTRCASLGNTRAGSPSSCQACRARQRPAANCCRRESTALRTASSSSTNSTASGEICRGSASRTTTRASRNTRAIGPSEPAAVEVEDMAVPIAGFTRGVSRVATPRAGTAGALAPRGITTCTRGRTNFVAGVRWSALACPSSVVGTSAAPGRDVQNTRQWLEKGARFGHFTKGVLYGLIGALALQVAIGSGGRVAGEQEAVGVVAEQPFGVFLLVALAVGLFGYAVWRLIEGVQDKRRK